MKNLLLILLLGVSCLSYAQSDIFEAARSGNVEDAMAMAEINPDTLTAESSAGYTPLILACYYDHLKFVRYLVEQGVEVNGEEGTSTALQAASYKGFTELAKFLLEAGADPDTRDANGMSPLHYASQFNHVEIVKLLVTHNADTDVQDSNGHSPADIARLLEHTEVEEILRR